MQHKDCLECSLKDCPAECFDRHVGSMIALGKLVSRVSREKNGMVIRIVDENGVGKNVQDNR